MSNLPTPVDPRALEAVTGGATARTGTSSTDQLLQTLTGLQATLKTVTDTANQTGFSTTDILMLGLLLSQNRQVGVFVHRPFW